ncbi:DNA-binding transcriptional ArsR family regulator [Actinopolyspora lacussalsi]|nr:DNA-binding transcriptional ArsR family regulator [Actinopolyspora lacussalsi]
MTRVTERRSEHQEARSSPEPLPEPSAEQLRLEKVLAALSVPLRLSIVRQLLLHADGSEYSCGWFDLDRPKSSLTHHFRVLREAGVLRQRQYGLERRCQLRIDDLEWRFPGLIDLIADWEPGPNNPDESHRQTQ